MDVQFTQEEEQRLAALAASKGQNVADLVKYAALDFLEEAHLDAAVEEGLASVERHGWIEEDEMDALFEKMLQS